MTAWARDALNALESGRAAALVTVLATAAISGLAGTTNAQASVAAAPVGSLTSVAYVNRIVRPRPIAGEGRDSTT